MPFSLLFTFLSHFIIMFQLCNVQFIVVLRLDDVAGIPANLQDKLRVRIKELNERNVSVLKMCQEADQVCTRKSTFLRFCVYNIS
jgi:hypothetical protein